MRILLLAFLSCGFVFTEEIHERPEQSTPPTPQQLKSRKVAGGLNRILGIGATQSAACVRRPSEAMHLIATNVRSTRKTWLGRWDSISELIQCIRRAPATTKKLVIAGHGAPDAVPPLGKGNYKRVARAIKEKGVEHVGFASCSVGRNAGRRNFASLPKLMARDSGATVVAFNVPILASPRAMIANRGTTAHTWTPGQTKPPPQKTPEQVPDMKALEQFLAK